ncbi:MAG: hypothetical protein CMJ88_13315 [Planctomycetes bacterium]|nr:hypothetical protein [Planctomycetota bacterium]
MRWMIAGLLFALAVTLAIATAALRADNVRARRELEQRYRRVRTQIVEFKRLSVQQLESVSPDELARLQWGWLQREGARREGQQQ